MFFIWFTDTEVAVVAMNCVFNFVVVGAWNCIDIVSTELYPTQLRYVNIAGGLRVQGGRCLQGEGPFVVVGAWNCIDIVSTELYPTQLRYMTEHLFKK